MRKAKIRLKYAGQCACCGAAIAAGETADYNAAKHEVTHEGGIKGACFSVLNEKANAPAKTHQEQGAERHMRHRLRVTAETLAEGDSHAKGL
jgi:hypothetical protein